VRSERRRLAAAELAERVKSIIVSRGLNLHAVSQISEATFGHASPHFIPHNFYYELTLGTFSPSLHQLFALSRITGYRLFDWLHVFGLDPAQIPRLQILLHTKRTVLLEPTLSDPNAWVRWFRNKSDQMAPPPMAPLSHLLEMGGAVRQKQLLEMNRAKFLYAKIGRHDAFAFPDLVPGSIVRVNPTVSEVSRESFKRMFLVEHSKGICCARLLPDTGRQITVVSTHLPYAEIRLKLPREARILGVVDLEIRRLAHDEEPGVPFEFARRWKPEPLDRRFPISHFPSSARRKAGLSLRDASQLTRTIAKLLDDDPILYPQVHFPITKPERFRNTFRKGSHSVCLMPFAFAVFSKSSVFDWKRPGWIPSLTGSSRGRYRNIAMTIHMNLSSQEFCGNW
jgi:hypothetical protein